MKFALLIATFYDNIYFIVLVNNNFEKYFLFQIISLLICQDFFNSEMFLLLIQLIQKEENVKVS